MQEVTAAAAGKLLYSQFQSYSAEKLILLHFGGRAALLSSTLLQQNAGFRQIKVVL